MLPRSMISIQGLTCLLLLLPVSQLSAAQGLVITNSNLVTTKLGQGTYTLDTNFQATSSLSNGLLVANQKGIISYSAKREGDPNPPNGVGGFYPSLQNHLLVSLYLDSATPLLAKNPKIAFDYVQTNQGGAGTTVNYEASIETNFDLIEFQDADGDHIYDPGEVFIITNQIGASYVSSDIFYAGMQHAIGDVTDLSGYAGPNGVEMTLNPFSHYLFVASSDLYMNAGNVAFDPQIPTIMAIADSAAPNLLGQQWVIEFQAVPEPSTYGLLGLGLAGLLWYRRRIGV